MTPSYKRVIQTLLWALKPPRNLRGSIPLPYGTTFLMVALDEGKGVSALPLMSEVDLLRRVNRGGRLSSLLRFALRTAFPLQRASLSKTDDPCSLQRRKRLCQMGPG